MARRPAKRKTPGHGAKTPKLLSAMAANPRNDWRIEQLVSVAEKIGLAVHPPKGGSHYVFSSDQVRETHLTVPYKRPIKPVYVRLFAEFCRAHLDRREASNG
ncbi:MAG: hypothetical protein LAT81_04875 [Oceanicaulis sp.]|nr:hypothetical protein [Oceanicaulis sp.]